MKTALRSCVALLASAASLCAAASTAKPNILLIVSDDHGYGDVSAYGCKDIPTPHLDSLARNGVRFTSGYVSCSYCSPTRAAMLTGRYQQRFGHELNPGAVLVPGRSDIGLPLNEILFPPRLKPAGYTTGIVGRWHLGFEPERHPMSRGFDEFFGFPGGSHSYTNSEAVKSPMENSSRSFDAWVASAAECMRMVRFPRHDFCAAAL